MNKFNIKCFQLIISLSFLLFSCSETPQKKSLLPYYKEATYTPHWFLQGESALDRFHQIRPFQLYNQEGDTITQESIAGKIYIADFFFTSCPGICLKMTNNMLILQEAFLEDPEILLLSHSVTPNYDSIPVLKSYAEEQGIISQKWYLLTGEKEEIYDLGRQAYFVEEDLGLQKDPDEFLHTENFVLVDKNRHIRGIYNGLNKTDIKQLIADVQTLKEEG